MEKAHRRAAQKSKNFKILVWAYWTPVILWMTTIFILSSQHKVTVSPDYWLNFLFFKTLHVIEYATLFTLLYRAWSASLGKGNPVAGKLAYILIILYAVSDETHQLFVPSREGAFRDVIIDALGAGLIWIYLSTMLVRAPKKLRSLANTLDIPY